MKLLRNLFLLTLLTGCSEPKVEFEHFLDRDIQKETERTITPLPEPDGVLNFTDYEIYSPGRLSQNSSDLYLINFGTLSILKISKERFQQPEVFTFSEGSGPGELRGLQSLTVSEDQLFIGDPRQTRLLITDTDGNYIRDLNTEFSPTNLLYLDENLLLNYNVHRQDFLFTFYDITTDTTSGFEEITFGFSETMKYPGYLDAGNSSIFFAGYSEPLLRKYSTDGTLHFSRSTIDNYNTENQYVERTMGETRVAGFSDNARYSSMDVEYFGDKLFVVPNHNDADHVKYIDLYDASNGDYLETLSLNYHPREIAVDDEQLYVLVRDGDDNLLLKFENPLK